MGGPVLIADASVLILFARVARLDLLQSLFSTLTLPTAVADEVFIKGPAAPELHAVKAAMDEGWLQSRDVPGDRIGTLAERFPNLGLGELACLALALEEGDSGVLMDDASARKIARLLGVTPVGSLGVVARAYHTGVINDRHEVAGIVHALVSNGLWVTADVVESFWNALSGRP